MKKFVPVTYGPNAPIFLLTCERGLWTYSVLRELGVVFGEERISWDMRDRKDIVIVSDVVKFSKMSAVHPALFTSLESQAFYDKSTKRPPHYKLSDVLTDLSFTPFFAHWPILRTEKLKVKTDTLQDYRL
jgi:hypothetical protein